jgi:hypothetical protein
MKKFSPLQRADRDVVKILHLPARSRFGEGRAIPLHVINSLIIITTLICKIPPNLPLPVFDRKKIAKGRNYPSLARGVGRFSNDYVNSILRPLIIDDDEKL